MFEFWFTFTAAYLAYVGYEAHRAIQCAEKGEPVLKPKDTAVPAAPIPAATRATVPLHTRA